MHTLFNGSAFLHRFHPTNDKPIALLVQMTVQNTLRINTILVGQSQYIQYLFSDEKLRPTKVTYLQALSHLQLKELLGHGQNYLGRCCL